jgi:tetratricopeptide (TPR) repeat protein
LPLGSAAGFASGKTARELVVFLATLYEVDPKEVVAFVTGFSDLQAAIDLPVASLSPSLRALLGYAVGYAIPCDFYLFDDSVTYGPESIRSALMRAFESRRASSATILATRNIRDVGKFGEIGCLLHDGHLHTFGSIDEAVEVYQRLELAALDPGHAYAQALIRTSGPQSAHAYLKSHLKEYEGDVDAHELLASLSVRLGASSDALTASHEALKQGSTSLDMHLIQAKAAESNARFLEAIERANVVLEMVPDHREARVIVARCQEALGNFEDAAEIWLSLSDESSALRAFMRGGNWKAVLEATRRSLETKPRDSRLLATQARALLEVADWGGLVRGIEELADIQPEEALNIVYRLVRSENWSAVREVLPQLRRFDLSRFRGTRNVDLIVRLIGRGSAAEYAAGRHVEAQQLIDMVAAIDPDRRVALPRARGTSTVPMGEEEAAPPALGT